MARAGQDCRRGRPRQQRRDRAGQPIRRVANQPNTAHQRRVRRERAVSAAGVGSGDGQTSDWRYGAYRHRRVRQIGKNLSQVRSPGTAIPRGRRCAREACPRRRQRFSTGTQRCGYWGRCSPHAGGSTGCSSTARARGRSTRKCAHPGEDWREVCRDSQRVVRGRREQSTFGFSFLSAFTSASIVGISYQIVWPLLARSFDIWRRCVARGSSVW